MQVDGVESFTEKLLQENRNLGLYLYEWDEEYRSRFFLARINQLWNVAKRTPYYKAVGKSMSRIETWEDYHKGVGVIKRNDYKNYMKSFFRYHNGEYITSKSGGVSGDPVTTYFSAKDARGVAVVEVANYLRLFREEGLKRFWDLSSDEKSATHREVWDGVSDADCYKGKIADMEELVLFLKHFRPDVFRATAYSVIKQTEMFEKALVKYPEIKEQLSGIKAYIFGGEFMPCATREYIESVMPNAKFISRYGTSQALGAIGYSRTDDNKNHVLNENLCYTALVDEHDNVVEGFNKEGRVVITQWHNTVLPILNVDMGDRAVYVKGERGDKRLRLLGRDDDLVILNTQKIDVKILLQTGAEFLKKMRFPVNGIGQVVKKGYRDIEFCYECFGINENELLKDDRLRLFSQAILDEVKTLAEKSGLPKERAAEKLEIRCVLCPNTKIMRRGERNKVKLLIDETYQ